MKMGREIRRVPANWEHPKNDKGFYEPLFNQTWEEAFAEWLEGKREWDNDPKLRAEAKEEYGCTTFAQWNGNPPQYEWYRPAFETEPTHYQIYETVTEGTPVSPVFENLDDMKAWLLKEGYSEIAASKFVEHGWAPSFFMQVTEDGPKMSETGIGALDFEFD
jgi:hypothetical protein